MPIPPTREEIMRANRWWKRLPRMEKALIYRNFPHEGGRTPSEEDSQNGGFSEKTQEGSR